MIEGLAVGTVQAALAVALAIIITGTAFAFARTLFGHAGHLRNAGAALIILVVAWCEALASLALLDGIGIYWGWWGIW